MPIIYSNQKINWNAKGIERKLQNIVNILNTYRYEIAYDRTLGRDPTNIDKPILKTKDKLIAETYELILEHDSKIKIKNVEVLDSNEGPIIKVVIDIV